MCHFLTIIFLLSNFPSAIPISIASRIAYHMVFISEDYYGDLDLKSIRKSELLAGLANKDNIGNKSKKTNQNQNQKQN